MSENTDLSKNYPSIIEAYPLAISSYETMHKRIDGIDAKNQQVTAFGVTLFLAIPVIFKPPIEAINSPLFATMMLLFIAAIIISLVSRYIGTIWAINPQKIYDQSLHLESIEFKRDFIYFAGEAFTKNSALLHQKWSMNLLSNLLLLSALFMSLVWASYHHS